MINDLIVIILAAYYVLLLKIIKTKPKDHQIDGSKISKRFTTIETVLKCVLALTFGISTYLFVYEIYREIKSEEQRVAIPLWAMIAYFAIPLVIAIGIRLIRNLDREGVT